jgi:hypothetical protein
VLVKEWLVVTCPGANSGDAYASGLAYQLPVADVAKIAHLEIVAWACTCQPACVSTSCYLLSDAAMPLAAAPCGKKRVTARSEF